MELNGRKIDLKFQYVFDTWCTSSLTPQIARNVLENLPFSLRPQAHEIIRTWTFYTLLKAVLHACEITNDTKNYTQIAEIDGKKYAISNEILKAQKHLPWHTVGLSGWCLESDKSKMSKSKGNAMDPKTLLATYGADVIRFWCSNTSLGMDSAFSEDRLDAGRKFVTKLWNVAKFVLQNDIAKRGKVEYDISNITNEVDLWLVFDLQNAIADFKKNLENMEYFHARKALDNFFWNIFCDNYLEVVKVRSYGIGAFIYREKTLSPSEITEIEQGQNSCVHAVFFVMEAILKLYAPYCPFVCEEIHSIIFGTGNIHGENSFAEITNLIAKINPQENANTNKWLEVIFEFRKAKTENTLEKFSDKFGSEIANMPSDIRLFCN
jgi:valyl-tRNA synthetase